MQKLWSIIDKKIAESIGEPIDVRTRLAVSGGCINQAYALQGPRVGFFVKINRSQSIDMFAAEYAGLNELCGSNTLRVPQPYCFGVANGNAFLAMELLSLISADRSSMVQLGQGLAAMHQITRSEFGWFRDNTIGSTTQINTPDKDWLTFWQQHRLGFQLALAANNGYRGKLQQQGDRLLAKLGGFFDHAPRPSLLHGDLWSGNFSATDTRDPAIFDPAVYYGDRETDLAMTELFGGYSNDFYSAYNDFYALDSGYSIRKTLYNLYHILNHLNIFGNSYLHQSQSMIDRLLSEV